MPLPNLEKSWEFDVNQPYTAGSTGLETHQKVLFGIKESLVNALASRPAMHQGWTVVRSSDSVEALSTDLWIHKEDLVFGSGDHSWIVLEQVGISDNFQICIDLSNADPTKLTIVWAPTGFPESGTGSGDTSNRPEAADEVVLLDDALWLGGQTTSAFRIHAMQSVDGQSTRILGFWQNHCVLFWLFEKPSRPVAGWALPAVALATGVDNGNVTYAALHTVASPNLWGYGSTGKMGIWMSTESFGNGLAAVGAQFAGPNAFDGNWPLTPIGLASIDGGSPGRHGELADLWFGSTTPGHGDTYPGDTSRRFAQFGHLVFPWDGTPEVDGTTPETA